MQFQTDECQCETCTVARNDVRSPAEEPAHSLRRVPRYEWPGQPVDLSADALSHMAEKGEKLVPRSRVDQDIKEAAEAEVVRRFTTGATRDVDTSKLDFDGFISPAVLEAFGTYMNYNRLLANGQRRASDNWQLGIPKDAYMKSGWRHFVDWWRIHRGYSAHENIVWAICGLLFNAMGYLHETLKADPDLLKLCLEQMEERRAASTKTTT